MKLDYHDLSEDQFEHLILAICTWLLVLPFMASAKARMVAKTPGFTVTPNAFRCWSASSSY